MCTIIFYFPFIWCHPGLMAGPSFPLYLDPHLLPIHTGSRCRYYLLSLRTPFVELHLSVTRRTFIFSFPRVTRTLNIAILNRTPLPIGLPGKVPLQRICSIQCIAILLAYSTVSHAYKKIKCRKIS